MSLKATFNLAQAQTSDAAEITAVNQVLDLPIKDFRWSKQEWTEEEINAGNYYVLHDKSGAIAGALCLHLFQEQSTGVVEAIAVRPDLQGQGLGDFMMKFAEETFRIAGMKEMCVESFHEYGVKEFYERCGFKCAPESPEFNGHPYYVLAKKLTSKGPSV